MASGKRPPGKNLVTSFLARLCRVPAAASGRITSLFCNGYVPNFSLAEMAHRDFRGDACSSEYDDLRGSTVSCEIVDRR